MASSSSANKVAKLAQKGKGKKVRFQGGTLFPVIIVVIVLVLGGLVVYARQSRPGPGEGQPTSLQHWHAAIGFYVCDQNGLKIEPNLTGALEETDASGQLISQRFVATGIHSHSDGVMHWHPNSSGKATGTNAKLKVFLDNYGVTLTNTKLAFPASQGGESFEEGKSKCVIGGVTKTASVKLWVWNNYSKVSTEDPQVYTTNMGDVRIINDGMVFMVAFVPDDVTPKPPETAFNLPALGAADGSGSTVTSDVTTVVGDTSVSTATTGTGTTGTATTGTGTTGTGPSVTTADTSTAATATGEPSGSGPTTTTKAPTSTTSG